MISTKTNFLCRNFVKYIENTSNVFIYKFDGKHVPSNITFPTAETVTIINCSKDGVFNTLTPYIFPNIKTINYISTHPGDYHIYKRFTKKPIKWIFPNKNYHFYTYMEVIGLGNKDDKLMNTYIKNKKIIDTSEFNICFSCDIEIPDYKLVDGEWYRQQFNTYCAFKQHEFYDDEDDELH
jgi:hypothetical protein